MFAAATPVELTVPNMNFLIMRRMSEDQKRCRQRRTTSMALKK